MSLIYRKEFLRRNFPFLFAEWIENGGQGVFRSKIRVQRDFWNENGVKGEVIFSTCFEGALMMSFFQSYMNNSMKFKK